MRFSPRLGLESPLGESVGRVSSQPTINTWEVKKGKCQPQIAESALLVLYMALWVDYFIGVYRCPGPKWTSASEFESSVPAASFAMADLT